MAIGKTVLELDVRFRPRAFFGQVLPPDAAPNGSESARILMRTGRRYQTLYTTPRADSGVLVGRDG